MISANIRQRLIVRDSSHDGLVDGLVIGNSDLTMKNLENIVDHEKQLGNIVTSFVFDRRFYSVAQIRKMTNNVEIIEQTRYTVGGDSTRSCIGDNECDIRMYIWDCGYIRMII